MKIIILKIKTLFQNIIKEREEIPIKYFSKKIMKKPALLYKNKKTLNYRSFKNDKQNKYTHKQY